MQDNETPLTLHEMLLQVAELSNEYALLCEQQAAELMIELLAVPRSYKDERVS